MEIAVALLSMLIFLGIIGASIFVVVLALRKQDATNETISEGFDACQSQICEGVKAICQHVTNAAIAIDNEAKGREQRVEVWIPPNNGCEICGEEAVAVVCGRGRPIWLCGECHADDEDFS